YVGLGRSPAPVLGALSLRGIDAASAPLSDFRPRPQDETLAALYDGWGDRSDRRGAPLTAEQRDALFQHFDGFLPAVAETPKSKILLLAYGRSGRSLIAAADQLQQYAAERRGPGRGLEVHALGMSRAEDVQRMQRALDSIASSGSPWLSRLRL